ncbi:MAG TPA: tRNA (adenosine(37)-N6)-dimethylallyltransferase MiaA [Bacteroidales bacterium]|jgi:tRNA dimethylallyltransferase|nr:tRNA (adenosine(37)-N6)-dimethylallyltransferase MiaA [Bacteroidales bacterium]HNR41607.1 tRNA (adenosine(37)-N6)-dimethylallyltransferase MiaA [Bacteroidales bacterium]HQG77633.1 tRNA (adenosine(37)-N6)-dimethylallyltransferase MiaA [Bacteroidales bacterium]
MLENEKSCYDLLVVTGPTASGKTALAAELALRLDGEVISADSRQVYRKMNLGSGKDYSEYVVEGNKIPYHLIDVAEPGYKYNVFEFQRDFMEAFRNISGRKKLPVVCGGSGMYLDSIVSGYNLVEVPPDHNLRSALEEKNMDELKGILESYKKLHNVTDLDTRKRVIRAIEIEHYTGNRRGNGIVFPKFSPFIAGILYSREKRRARISERLRQRFESGMVDEVRELLRSGLSPESLIYYGLEYKYITLYVTGRLNFDEMFKGLETAIHRYAKRQMTWFRGMERKGIKIHWIDGELPREKKVEMILKKFSSRPEM